MVAIKLNNVSKCYWVYETPFKSLVGMIAPKMVEPQEVWALKDINFEVKKGECVGIIGNNGSGKSTLLSLMGGIVTPTTGAVETDGEISTLLDLMVGMQPELTGRANIQIIGKILGLTDEEIELRTPEVIDFCELDEALDRPVKTYSTGMAMRLGFSIGLHSNFDIFLVDEVLAVGDSNFHRKCIDRMRLLHQQDRRTIMMASHGLGEIGALADWLILLNKGRILDMGTTEDVLASYWHECERQRNQIGRRVSALKPVNPYGDDLGDVKIELVRFIDKHGFEKEEFITGEEMIIEIWYLATRRVVNPLFRVQLFRNDGLWVHGMNTFRHEIDSGAIEGRGCARLRYGAINLLEADYYVSVGIWPDEYTSFITDVAYDYREKSFKLQIRSMRMHGAGIVNHECQWDMLPPESEEAERAAAELVERGLLPALGSPQDDPPEDPPPADAPEERG